MQENVETNLSHNYCLNSAQFLLVLSLNVKFYYRANSDSRGINGRYLDPKFFKQTKPESVYVAVYIPT